MATCCHLTAVGTRDNIKGIFFISSKYHQAKLNNRVLGYIMLAWHHSADKLVKGELEGGTATAGGQFHSFFQKHF